VDGNILQTPDTPFTNLDWGQGLLVDNPSRQISGIEKLNPTTYRINNVDEFIDHLKRLYLGEDGNGIPLHPDTEALIRNYINQSETGVFNVGDGVPGAHAEIQALNSLYTQAGGRENLNNVRVGTVLTRDSTDFETCNNCRGIIEGDPNVLVLTN